MSLPKNYITVQNKNRIQTFDTVDFSKKRSVLAEYFDSYGV